MYKVYRNGELSTTAASYREAMDVALGPDRQIKDSLLQDKMHTFIMSDDDICDIIWE
jgi:hypothetical protein